MDGLAHLDELRTPLLELTDLDSVVDLLNLDCLHARKFKSGDAVSMGKLGFDIWDIWRCETCDSQLDGRVGEV